jgi:hypothetical protein
MTFAEYIELMRLQVVPPEGTDAPTRVSAPYAALLNQRFMRNLQAFVVCDELREIVAKIRAPQEWMVLTEPSCGDSSQLVPLIARIAECNSRITLNLVLRDQRPELMDMYLTTGKRSIPKLVSFDEGRRELFRWGPRPRPAQELFEQAIKEGHPKQAAIERVHLFYAKDKGKAVEQEFLEILRGNMGD